MCVARCAEDGACDMACYHPIYAVRTETGAVRLGYDGRDAAHRLDLPCGRCIGCRKRRALEFSVRAQLEHSLWPVGRMLTLTYDEEHIPPNGSLRRADYTKFAKRLRKRVQGVAPAPWDESRFPLRILACGEYGTRSGRPHYHAIVSNLQFPDEVGVTGRSRGSDLLSELWPFGHSRVDDVTPASISYVAGYVRKKAGSEPRGKRFYEDIDDETGEVLLREMEFVQTPQKPGLGLPWLWRYGSDLRKQFVVLDGKKRPIPRYFVEKMASDSRFVEARERHVFDVVERAKLDSRPPAAVRAAEELIALARDKSRRDGV